MMPDDIGPEAAWFCLKCRTKQEPATARVLALEPEIDVFCPMLQFESIRWGKPTLVREAMFPGYFFACFSYPEFHRRVAHSQGVSTIVRFGERPAMVSSEIIVQLKVLVDHLDSSPISAAVEAGDEVTLAEGAFCGLRALVTRVLPGRQRIAVLLELLGATREVEVALKSVVADTVHPLRARQSD